MTTLPTRARIVATADRLFYEHGFEHTSFATIASAVGISRGNFYHHFKTKDEILHAVIESRLAATRDMLAGWEAESPDPAERVRQYVQIVIRNEDAIQLHGCPVGTLSGELSKIDHPARRQALGLFEMFRDWLVIQFSLLGREREAEDLALHVLMFSQGTATVSNAFRDPAWTRREVERFERWLTDELATA
ncbi:TetR/AcrR family transcriptional regulator [Mycobacterium sp. ITM-2016-00316]|uniref:TetR/AcrR family transcriptional regulator n=1 Tax=Mycobacterium sp. ITM-2016-00316 TaxID=2099695 RepID=UPI000CFA5E16|nr:TetR/AcrR family transcriptional regulator [Mycobacterium sp. ITM-2016-00316]WNG83159.1 TetR/AcrR family transcriptional regulator [Mycobacterium sp. ITM-2016-00316]